MPNPYNYNELYMHSQRDAHWDQTPLGHSNATMHGFGCLVSCAAYLSSRVLGYDVTPGAMCDWLNRNAGFDSNGNMCWDAIRRFTNGKLKKWPVAIGAKFTVLKVAFAGQTHYVVLLKNPANGQLDIIYDPWQLPSVTPVQSRHLYPQVLGVIYFRA